MSASEHLLYLMRLLSPHHRILHPIKKKKGISASITSKTPKSKKAKKVEASSSTAKMTLSTVHEVEVISEVETDEVPPHGLRSGKSPMDDSSLQLSPAHGDDTDESDREETEVDSP